MKLLAYKMAAGVWIARLPRFKRCALPESFTTIKVGNETRIMESDLLAWMQRGRHYHSAKSSTLRQRGFTRLAPIFPGWPKMKKGLQ